MYCPKCSQQQVSDEMRFCARCGFPLSAVRDVVANAGTPTPTIELVEVPRVPKGVRRGMRIILASLVFAFFVLMLSLVNEDFVPFLLLCLPVILVGFLFLLYGTFVEPRRSRIKGTALPQPQAANAPQISAPMHRPQLSSPAGAPVQDFVAPKVQTAEMVQPPSVTERTTRLLESESEQSAK